MASDPIGRLTGLATDLGTVSGDAVGTIATTPPFGSGQLPFRSVDELRSVANLGEDTGPSLSVSGPLAWLVGLALLVGGLMLLSGGED